MNDSVVKKKQMMKLNVACAISLIERSMQSSNTRRLLRPLYRNLSVRTGSATWLPPAPSFRQPLACELPPWRRNLLVSEAGRLLGLNPNEFPKKDKRERDRWQAK